MKLSSILRKDLVFWNIEAKNIDHIYDIVSNAISDISKVKQEEIKNAFIERDKLGYTISNGFAIPHGRIKGFDDVIVCIVKLKSPIILDNKDVDFFFILLTSKQGSNLYLKTLAAIATLISKYGKIIKNIETEKELHDFIHQNDIKLTEPVKVSEIMNDKAVVVTKDMKVSEVMDLMKKTGITFFPVVDKNNIYIGKVDIIDILKLAYPDYVLMMNDLSFLTNFRAYEEFEKKELTNTIEDVYIPLSKERKIIYEDINIIELGFLIVKNHWHHVTVVDKQNKVLGIISATDLLNRILRT